MRKLFALTLLLFAAGPALAQQTTFTPNCAGTNDTAAFSTIISAVGSNPATIRLPYKPGTRCAVNSITVPANVALDNTDGSGLKINTGQTLTLSGPAVNPPGKQFFYNATAGLGTVVLGGGVYAVYPEWWGAAADAVAYESCSTTSGSAVVTCSGASFTSSLVGKKAVVALGSAGATVVASITGTTSTQLTLASTVGATASGVRVVVGTENSAAYVATVAATSGSAAAKTIQALAGAYLFTSRIGTLHRGAMLKGTYSKSPRHYGYRYANELKPMAGDGTCFVIAANEGTSSGSYFIDAVGSDVSGISFFHPAQLTSLTTPKTYPWVIRLTGVNPSASHLELVNPYQGIYVHNAHGATVDDFQVQPLGVGFYASQLLDTSWLTRANAFPGYTFMTVEDPGSGVYTPLQNYVNQYAVAYKFGRVDNFQGTMVGLYGIGTGFKFVVDSPESSSFAGTNLSAPGGKAWAHFSQVLADGCVKCIDIDDVSKVEGGGSGQGVSFESGNLVAYPYIPPSPAPSAYYAVITSSSFSGYLRMKNFTFDGSPGGGGHPSAAGLTFAGANGTIDIEGSTFTGRPQLIDVDAYAPPDGTTPLFLSLRGNSFQRTTAGVSAVQVSYNVIGRSLGNLFKLESAKVLNRAVGGSNFYIDADIATDSYAPIGLTPQGGWSNSGGGFAVAAYYVAGRQVCLRGTIMGGATVAGVTQLLSAVPAGLRPASGDRVIGVESDGTQGAIRVSASSGITTYIAGSNTRLSLDGACWDY